MSQDRARDAHSVTAEALPNPDLLRLKDISHFDKAEVLTRVIIMGVLAVAVSVWLAQWIYLWFFAAYAGMSAAAILLVQRAPDTLTRRSFSLYSLVVNSPIFVLFLVCSWLWANPEPYVQMLAIALLLALMVSMLMIRSIDAVVVNWDAVGMALTMVVLVGIDLMRHGATGRTVITALMLAGALAYFLHCASVIVRVRRSLDEAQVMEVQRSKVEAIGRLTGGVAHDFNNLLTVILGNMELAQLAHSDAERKTLLGEAQAAGQRAARLTAQLLAFARQSQLHPERVDVGQSLAKTEALLARLLPSNIRVSIVPGSADVPPVAVDLDTFETVLLNLAINARDAMRDGGRLRLGARAMELFASEGDLPAGQYVVVMVNDTGTGIPADILARVTEPFYTTKPVGQGSGLGLSMAKGFAEQSGGQLDIASVPGRGTEVSVTLPVAS